MDFASAPSKNTTEIELRKYNGQTKIYIHFLRDETGLEGYYTYDAGFRNDWVWVPATQLLPSQHDRWRISLAGATQFHVWEPL